MEIQTVNQSQAQIQPVQNTAVMSLTQQKMDRFTAVCGLIRERKTGRPTKFRPKLIKKLYDKIAEGATLTDAFKICGLSHETVNEWRRQHAGFSALISEAESVRDQVHGDSAETVLTGAIKSRDLETSKYWLERRRPGRFSNKRDENSMPNLNVIVNFAQKANYNGAQ